MCIREALGSIPMLGRRGVNSRSKIYFLNNVVKSLFKIGFLATVKD